MTYVNRWIKNEDINFLTNDNTLTQTLQYLNF